MKWVLMVFDRLNVIGREQRGEEGRGGGVQLGERKEMESVGMEWRAWVQTGDVMTRGNLVMMSEQIP